MSDLTGKDERLLDTVLSHPASMDSYTDDLAAELFDEYRPPRPRQGRPQPHRPAPFRRDCITIDDRPTMASVKVGDIIKPYDLDGYCVVTSMERDESRLTVCMGRTVVEGGNYVWSVVERHYTTFSRVEIGSSCA